MVPGFICHFFFFHFPQLLTCRVGPVLVAVSWYWGWEEVPGAIQTQGLAVYFSETGQLSD